MSNKTHHDCCHSHGAWADTPGKRRHRHCADPSQPYDLRPQCRHEQFYLNQAQTFTAHCPSGFEGDSVTVTIAAGTVASTISVADANEQAYEYALETAESEISCLGLFYNMEQTATIVCPNGDVKQATVQAGLYSSTVSQDAANALAYTSAVQAAQEQCGTAPVGIPITTFDGLNITTFDGQNIVTMT